MLHLSEVVWALACLPSLMGPVLNPPRNPFQEDEKDREEPWVSLTEDSNSFSFHLHRTHPVLYPHLFQTLVPTKLSVVGTGGFQDAFSPSPPPPPFTLFFSLSLPLPLIHTFIQEILCQL